MDKKLRLNLYNGETVKWENDGKLFCLHVRMDSTPSDQIGRASCRERVSS